MFAEVLEQTQQRLHEALQRLTEGRWWAARVALGTTLLVLLLSFPSYRDLGEIFSEKTWQGVMIKARAPGHNLLLDFGPWTNAARVNFRLLMPMLARMLSLGPAGLVAIQAAAGVVLFFLIALLAERITASRAVAVAVAVMIGSTWAGMTAFVELRGVFDAVAILLLVCCLYARNPLLVMLFVFLAGWDDERALLASPLVLVFLLLQRKAGSEGLRVKDFFSPRILGLCAGLGIHAVTRLAYAHAFGIPIRYDANGVGVLASQINMIPMGVWTALEGGWLLVGGAFVVLMKERRRVELVLFLLALGFLLGVAMCTVDVSRSTAYCLPAVFVALTVLRRSETPEGLWRLTITSSVLAILWPPYYAGGKSTIWLQYPLPFQLIRFWRS